MSVNDPFVMNFWGEAALPLTGEDKGTLGPAAGKIRMIADPCCKFTEAMDMVLTKAVEVLGNNRSQRYMCVIEDGVVVAFKHDATGVENTSAESALKELQKLGVKKAKL